LAVNRLTEVLTDPDVLARLRPDIIIDPESVVDKMVQGMNLDSEGVPLPEVEPTVPTYRTVFVEKWINGRRIDWPRLVIVSSSARRNPAARVITKENPS
jgi:hypothetical protein